MNQPQITNFFKVNKRASILHLRKMKRQRLNLSLKKSGIEIPDPIELSSGDEEISAKIRITDKKDCNQASLKIVTNPPPLRRSTRPKSKEPADSQNPHNKNIKKKRKPRTKTNIIPEILQNGSENGTANGKSNINLAWRDYNPLDSNPDANYLPNEQSQLNGKVSQNSSSEVELEKSLHPPNGNLVEEEISASNINGRPLTGSNQLRVPVIENVRPLRRSARIKSKDSTNSDTSETSTEKSMETRRNRSKQNKKPLERRIDNLENTNSNRTNISPIPEESLSQNSPNLNNQNNFAKLNGVCNEIIPKAKDHPPIEDEAKESLNTSDIILIEKEIPIITLSDDEKEFVGTSNGCSVTRTSSQSKNDNLKLEIPETPNHLTEKDQNLLNSENLNGSDCILVENEITCINLSDCESIPSPQKSAKIEVQSKLQFIPIKIEPEVKSEPSLTEEIEITPDLMEAFFGVESNEKDHDDVPDREDAHVKFTMHILNYVFDKEPHRNLFTENHNQLYERSKTLSLKNQRFVIRLFYRKFGWHRWETLSKTEFSSHVNLNDLQLLENLGFISLSLTDISLENMLNLLSAGELQSLGKKYMLKAAKKGDIIQAILKHANTKRGVASYFNSSKSVLNIVINDVKDVLGPCVRLNEDWKTVMGRSQLLFAINDYETRQELHRMMYDFMQSPMCLGFQLDTPKLFPSEPFFAEYESCRFLCEEMINAMEKKDNLRALEITLTAYQEFTKVLTNEEYLKQIEDLPAPFLKRFSPGHSLCVILSTGLVVLKQEHKKPSTYDSTITNLLQSCFKSNHILNIHLLQILDALLHPQNIWKPNRKVEWLHEKLMILRQQKQFEEAERILIESFKSEHFTNSELYSLVLCSEKQLLPKKLEISKELDELFKKYEKGYNFAEEYIYADKLEVGAATSRKSVFHSTDMFGDAHYLSVEQVALNHYKQHESYAEGVHCEGTPIYALFTLLFWDIIFEIYVPNTFISPLQKLPLDLYSRHFYENRKDLIDQRLTEMESWSEEEFDLIIQNVIDTKAVGASVFDYSKYDGPFLKTICKCMRKRNVVVEICRKLAKEYGVYYAGFPDLILWDIPTRKIKFVEVKGPGDKLRPKQKLWLHFLQSIEANAEVCYVKDKSAKSLSPRKTPQGSPKKTPQSTPKNSPTVTPHSSPRKTPQSSPSSRKLGKMVLSPKKKAVKRLNML